MVSVGPSQMLVYFSDNHLITTPDKWMFGTFEYCITKISILWPCFLGWCECTNPCATAHVLLHRIQGLLQGRHQLLRQAGSPVLHPGQDRDPAMEGRRCDPLQGGRRHAGPQVNKPLVFTQQHGDSFMLHFPEMYLDARSLLYKRTKQGMVNVRRE